jgi:hypothetical protein
MQILPGCKVLVTLLAVQHHHMSPSKIVQVTPRFAFVRVLQLLLLLLLLLEGTPLLL